MRTTSLVGGLALVAACAQSPDAIARVSMGNAFSAISCNQARSKLVQERQTLAALESKQRSAITGDAVGVFLIGVPVSSLSGNDVAGSIGASNGKAIALENRLLWVAHLRLTASDGQARCRLPRPLPSSTALRARGPDRSFRRSQ